jgi:hypothetical protein
MVVIGVVALFVFAKVWVLRHPKGVAAIIIGAAILIISEPAKAA